MVACTWYVIALKGGLRLFALRGRRPKLPTRMTTSSANIPALTAVKYSPPPPRPVLDKIQQATSSYFIFASPIQKNTETRDNYRCSMMR